MCTQANDYHVRMRSYVLILKGHMDMDGEDEKVYIDTS
jgi:hypothetical protein